MEEEILALAIKNIADDPQKLVEIIKLLDDVNLPNINFPTMGGHVFWNNLASYNGWRIQQNTITHHCRILDPNDIRRAWGGLNAMEKVFRKMADAN